MVISNLLHGLGIASPSIIRAQWIESSEHRDVWHAGEPSGPGCKQPVWYSHLRNTALDKLHGSLPTDWQRVSF